MDIQERSKRSVTLIKDKTPEKLLNLYVDFDEQNQAIGKYQGEFSSYCGVATRRRISILIESWNKVPVPQRDELWLDIKNYWNIPNDAAKKRTLKVCNQAWRAYKSTLVIDYMDKGIDPTGVYPYLKKPAWAAFVKLKATKEFEVKRKKGRETVKKNKNPAHLGPRGYRGNKHRWDKDIELGAKIKGHHISSEQARDFIFARTKRTPSGEYKVVPESESLADAFIEKDKPGVDLMTEVLGPEHPGRTRAVGYNVTLKESRKRTQNELPDLDDLVKTLEERLFQRLYDKLYDKLMIKVADTIGDMIDSMVATKVNQNMMQTDEEGVKINVSSLNLKKPSVEFRTLGNELDSIEVPIECELLLPSDTERQAIAEGKVYPSENGVLHGIPLKEHHVKVSIRKVYDGYKLFPLPVPTEETYNLGNALYGFTQWPRNSVSIVKSTPTVLRDQISRHAPTPTPTPAPAPARTPTPRRTPAPTLRPTPTPTPAPLPTPILTSTTTTSVTQQNTAHTSDEVQKKRRYQEMQNSPIKKFGLPKQLNGRPNIKLLYKNFMCRNIEFPIHIRSEPGIFGVGRTELAIYQDLVQELMTDKKLDIDSILCFQMMLHPILPPDNRCAFINPLKIASIQCEIDEDLETKSVVNELVDAMHFHHEKDIFLAPYLQGVHYVLIVICPRERTGYILDSCQYTKTLEDYDIVKHVEEAVAVVNKNSTSHAMTWTLATCNQQKSDWECGYYVSYWMHDFLWYRQYRFPMNLWNDSRPFAGVELDNFVELWMKLFVKNYLK